MPIIKILSSVNFIKLSKTAIADIENGINDCLYQLTNFDGVLKNKKIGISFVEFEKLRDVVKTMTSITLLDGNNHSIASKGSGAQRAVFLSLMQYISQNSKKLVIWGIDEPEAFLHPRLQKKVVEVLNEMCEKENQCAILTTHSQHFINLNHLSNTYVFRGDTSQRTYARKPNVTFYEINTTICQTNSNAEKAMLIKRQLGIANNDGWEVLPFNLIVEGEEDKKYLETFLQSLNLPSINIVWSGGASKMSSHLQYFNTVAKDLSYKPEFICIFDNDQEGREKSRGIKPDKYKNIKVKVIRLIRHDGLSPSQNLKINWEIEDFISPELILNIVNQILRDDGYKQLTKKQIKEKVNQAHINKPILQYAEECCSFINPSKASMVLDEDARKMQICQLFCKEYSTKIIPISSYQEKFLKSLVPNF